MHVRSLLLLFGLLALSFGALAAEGVDAGSFTRFGVGGRALGMGGAFVAVADDVTTTYWNPAGLVSSTGISLGGMYTNKFSADVNFQFVAATASWDVGRLGLSMVRQAIEDIPFYGDGEGEFFSEYQTLWLASAAYDLSANVEGLKLLGLGANLKYYTHTLLEGQGQGFGFDLAALMQLELDWGLFSFGLCSQDILTTRIHWKGTDFEPIDPVPWINKLGLALVLLDGRLGLVVDGDLALDRPNLNRLHLGVELWVVEALGLRGGVMFWADGTLHYATGGSFRLGEVSLDYAYLPHEMLGASHILSVEFHWDTAAPEEPSPSPD